MVALGAGLVAVRELVGVRRGRAAGEGVVGGDGDGAGDGAGPIAGTDDGDFSRPLQLLARSVEFTDPLTGRPRRFVSGRSLRLW